MGSLPPPSALPPPTAIMWRTPGGGRGGVGKSVLAVNMAVYLAQLGRSVVLVDADPAGAELHTMLGLPPAGDPGRAGDRSPSAKADDGSDEGDERELDPVPTQVPGLKLLPQLYRVGSTVPVRPGSKPRWARHLRQLDADYVLLDLGSGTLPSTLDLFLMADLGLCVTAPEPPSIEATYRFMRALFLRVMRRLFVTDRFKMRLFERAQADLGPLPSPQDLVRALARYDTSLANQGAVELAQMQARLVVNGARLRTDVDLGPAMCDMSTRYLGVTFDYVGHIEQDDSVWLSVVRRRPLLIDSPTSKSARNLERIARRVLALFAAKPSKQAEAPIPLIPHEPSLYDLLLTHRGATDEDVRRAYKRQREIYLSGSLPLTSLLDEDQLRSEQARIEEAHDTLLDPIRRKAYDASTFPDEAEARPMRPSIPDTALEAERELLRQELSREINAETEFTGSLLRKVRESQGIEIEDIAKHTKISLAHLKAIEVEAFGELPALVYTRGFVQEVAKFLKLDVAQVTRTYLRRFKTARSSEGDTNP